MEKEKELKLEKVYMIHVKDYIHQDPFNDNKLTGGDAVISISSREYKILKASGFPTEEYSEVVFSRENQDYACADRPFIRQIMLKHVVYVDKACHTNF